MDKHSKRFKALLLAIPVIFVILVVVFFQSARNRHVFTVYADGDYISQNLLDQFTQETGIRVRLVTGDRTPEAGANALLPEEEDASAVEEAKAQAIADGSATAAADELTLPELLQQPRDEVLAKAQEKAAKNGEASVDESELVYPPSEYDVVLTDGATLGTLREQGLIQPLTYAKVSNLKNITSEYRKLSYDPEGEYTVTTMWEYVGLLVNTNLVNEQVTSWDVLWDEKYAGEIVMPGQVRDAMAVALLAMGENPASAEPARLNAALDKLEAQKDLVVSYSGRDAYLLLQNDKAAFYPCWSGDALAMMRENPALVYLLPPGGTYRTAFGYAVPADAKYTDDAHAFINFMCKTESLAINAVYSKYASTSEAAVDKLDESWSDNPVIYPAASVLASTPLLNPLPLDVADHCNLRWKAISTVPVQDSADGEGDSSAASGSAAQAEQSAVQSAATPSSAARTDSGSAPSGQS
jgi:spermidine/putrescine transport system substrate-binding protein